MRKTLTVEIEGTRYKLRQVGARASSRMMLILLGFIEKAGSGKLQQAIDAFIGEPCDFVLDAFTAETKIETILSTGTKIEVALDFDEHFAGEHMAYLLWVKACFDLNFSSFLGDLARRFPEGLAATVSGLKQQVGSIGGSGAS